MTSTYHRDAQIRILQAARYARRTKRTKRRAPRRVRFGLRMHAAPTHPLLGCGQMCMSEGFFGKTLAKFGQHFGFFLQILTVGFVSFVNIWPTIDQLWTKIGEEFILICLLT